MADFACWKYENLVSFAEAASKRLMEMDKRIATERMLAYEWGYEDGRRGVDSSGQATPAKRSLDSGENIGRVLPGGV